MSSFLPASLHKIIDKLLQKKKAPNLFPAHGEYFIYKKTHDIKKFRNNLKFPKLKRFTSILRKCCQYIAVNSS